jgi:hypothetical protein
MGEGEEEKKGRNHKQFSSNSAVTCKEQHGVNKIHNQHDRGERCIITVKNYFTS